jgi:hypothetical protein
MTNYLNRTLPVALFIAATAATTAYAQEGGSTSRDTGRAQNNRAAYTATVQEGRASTSTLDSWTARNGETAIRIQESRAANES